MLETMTLERQNWVLILEKLNLLEQDFRDHMEMFSQRAALLQALQAEDQTKEAGRQSREANRMARSSGQLTKIATVIVPCSFVASMFSMGDDFAAGKRLFFLYWVISMPATLILLIWVIHGTRFTEAWKRAKTQSAEQGQTGSKRVMLRLFLLNLRSPAGREADPERFATDVIAVA